MQVKSNVGIGLLALLLVKLLFILPIQAQVGSVSPYSRYGIGDLQSGGIMQNYSMGGLAAALQNDTVTPFFVNPSNPASYPNSRITAFEAGGVLNSTLLKTSSQQQRINSPSMSYMSLSIPLKKWWGMGFGIMPYSSVGYKIRQKAELDSIGTVEYLYEGEGGINKVYWGNGFKLFNHLYLGADANFLFGNITNKSRVSFPENASAIRYFYNNKTTRTTRVSDFNFNYGLQYVFDIDSLGKRNLSENVKIVLGANVSYNKTLNARTDFSSINFFQNNFGYEVNKDTVEISAGVRAVVPVPFTYSAGMVVQKGSRWMIGAEYRIVDWKTNPSDNYAVEVDNLDRSGSYMLGAQYFPGAKDEKYLNKVYYRAGARFTESNFKVNGNTIPEYAMSVGMALPVGMNRHMLKYSLLNVGLELGKRGSISNGMIEERFVRVLIGFTANDRWFIKPKFD